MVFKESFNITLFIIITLFSFSSCKVVQTSKFASSDQLLKVELNSTLDDVIAVLGTKPYNILGSQTDGYTIYQYHYKLVERTIDFNSKTYNSDKQDLLLFFRDNKLESFVTTEGQSNVQYDIKLANTLYVISENRDGYTLERKTKAPQVSSVNTGLDNDAESGASKPSAPPLPDFPKLDQKVRKNSQFWQTGSHQIFAGIGTWSYERLSGPLALSYFYKLNRHISAGATFQAYKFQTYYNGEGIKIRSIAGRANYHFLKTSILDTYVGLGFGGIFEYPSESGVYSEYDGYAAFDLPVYAGLRCALNQKFGISTEICISPYEYETNFTAGLVYKLN